MDAFRRKCEKVPCQTCGKHFSYNNLSAHQNKCDPERIGRKRAAQSSKWCEVCKKLVYFTRRDRHTHAGQNPRSRHQYTRATDDAIRIVKVRVDAAIAVVNDDQTSPRQTRLSQELPTFRDRVLHHIQPPHVLSCHEYLEHLSASAVQIPRHSVVVCNTQDARRLLEVGGFRVPIVLRKALPPTELICMDDFLVGLRRASEIDVHVFDDAGTPRARKVSSEEVARLMNDRTTGPINLLNLRGWKQNPVPKCLTGLRTYCGLDDFVEVDDRVQCGKQVRVVARDLSSCVNFHLCAKRGAFSLPHIDHHGVMTTIQCEAGRKLWTLWPDFTPQERQMWFKGQEPGVAPYALLLEPGDLLIQPPGLRHAPYSIDNVLMTGTMHWDLRRIHESLEYLLLSQANPQLTNEDSAMELEMKLESVLGTWKRAPGGWQWPSNAEMQYFDQLRMCILKKWKGCDCKTCGARCRCHRAAVPCGFLCRKNRATGLYLRKDHVNSDLKVSQ